jgi:hypothetical protein
MNAVMDIIMTIMAMEVIMDIIMMIMAFLAMGIFITSIINQRAYLHIGELHLIVSLLSM